ncbi:MAG: hypothetical protein JO269_05035 [Burkholderiaceae bacterium]|nr:hypothetical protein [Burkholderiaceae bacterium]
MEKNSRNNQQAQFSNCFECKHYFITWDPKFPYGCHGMNFKSKRQPRLEVLEASGQVCLMFEKKKRA